MEDTLDQPTSLEDILNEAREERDAGAQDLTTEFDAASDPRDLQEEQDLVAGERGEIPEQPSPIGFEPMADMEEDPYRDLRARVEQKFTRTYNDKTVVVTELERRRYLRAAVHGETLWFDVEFPSLGVTVRVVPSPPGLTDSVAQVIKTRRGEGLVGDDVNSWIDHFQMYHIWLQVDHVNKEPQPWFQSIIEERDGKVPGCREMLKILNDDGPVDQIRALSSARRHLLLSAIRVAEIKTCICMDALSDGSFFSSAGTN